MCLLPIIDGFSQIYISQINVV